MLLRRVIPLLVISVIHFLSSSAQSYRYQLETFGTRNGMLSSKVYALFQAGDRRLWIGTESGISVYDGYRFINYQYTTANESIGRILCITQDKEKGLWIGGDKGLFYCSNDSVRKIELQSGIILAVESLLTDEDGNIWAGDINALYQITAEQANRVYFNQAAIIDLQPHGSFNKRVFALAADSKQNIYAGSYDGIFRIKKNGGAYENIWTNPEPRNPVRLLCSYLV